MACLEMSAISSSSPDDPEIRILLMGRNGSGKSSSGNTILGQQTFKVQKCKKKHEAEVCEGKTQMGDKQVRVIDCPDLLDPDLNQKKLEKMKAELIKLCRSGLSAVLLTVPLGEPVQNEEEILYFITCLFGPEVQKYIMILFTHGDELDNKQTIDEHLQKKDHADLQQLVTECGGKFHCFNQEKNVKGLLQDIEGIMRENGGKFVMEKMKRRDSKDEPDVEFSGESPAEDPERKDPIRLDPVLLGETGSGKTQTEWQKMYWHLVEESQQEAKKPFSDTFVAELLMCPNVNVSDMRSALEKVVTLEEKESAIKEAESKGLRRDQAIKLAINITRKLAFALTHTAKTPVIN